MILRNTFHISRKNMKQSCYNVKMIQNKILVSRFYVIILHITCLMKRKNLKECILTATNQTNTMSCLNESIKIETGFKVWGEFEFIDTIDE